MTTSFSCLPIVDLAVLSAAWPSPSDLSALSRQLHHVFATTGFAYLMNAPLSFSHDDVFDLAREFFCLENNAKMSLAKKSFVHENQNTYRGYFPPQPGRQDNLKEGFEIGSSQLSERKSFGKSTLKVNLAEPNVWPSEVDFPSGRARMERLHDELQTLSSTLLSLLAVSLGKDAHFFSAYLDDSLSTLRLLRYPAQPPRERNSDEIQLCCSPHTDSGIMTLLHQDPTGGLEVRNAAGEWVSAPYLPGSIVVNIGDLLADVSGGRFVATMHRVRACHDETQNSARGRLSVPFFFEPGEDCVLQHINGACEGLVYGAHVRRKMGTWIEFQDPRSDSFGDATSINVDTREDLAAVA